MAEILIKAVDATNSDPVKDLRGCYKRGDPVVIFENGHEWGRLELMPPKDGGKFVVLKITDVTVAQVENYLQNRWGISICGSQVSAGERIRRRLVGVTVDSLPAAVRNTMNNTGEYSTTWTAIKNYVKNKVTGEAV